MNTQSDNSQLYLKIANLEVYIKEISNIQQRQYPKFENLIAAIKKYLPEFITQKKPHQVDLQINLRSVHSALSKTKYTNKSIESLIDHFHLNARTKIINSYSNQSFSQFISLLNIAIDYLLNKNSLGIYFHASAIIKDKGIVLFVGPSGIGKSTVSQLLKNKYPVFADDLLILKQEQNQLYGFQAPVVNKITNPMIKTNQGYPIKALLLLEKNPKTQITMLKKDRRLYTKLLSQTVTYSKISKHHLSFIKKLIKNDSHVYLFKNNKNKMEIDLIIKKLSN